MRILLLGVLLPLAACNVHNDSNDDGTPGIAGQGAGNTRTYPVTGFTAVDLRGSDNVDIRVGPGFSVRADGKAELLDRVKIEKVGDTLRISRRNASGFSMGGDDTRVSVTMPQLTAASVAGSGDMSVDRVAGGNFRGAAAGSGNLSVGALQVDSADLSLAGSGDMKVAGTAKQLRVSVAGSGDVDGGGLTANGADVSIAGSGSVRAEVDGAANVSVMGSGDVDLGGKARCTTSKMGSSTVRCGS